MNNEIKEILDNLLFTTTLENVTVKLNKDKLNQLKDYITKLQQEYVSEVYLRWITEKECERNPEYNKVRRLERKDKNVSNRI